MDIQSKWTLEAHAAFKRLHRGVYLLVQLCSPLQCSGQRAVLLIPQGILCKVEHTDNIDNIDMCDKPDNQNSTLLEKCYKYPHPHLNMTNRSKGKGMARAKGKATTTVKMYVCKGLSGRLQH